MGIFSWIIVGGIAGYLANLYMKTGQKDMVITVLQGMAGAAIGGFIATMLRIGTSNGISLGNILFATIGSVLLIMGLRKLSGRSPRR